MKQPYCRYCGKKIAKSTHHVHFGQRYRREGDETRRDVFPRSKMDAQRHVNGAIVSVSWYGREEHERDGADVIAAGGPYIHSASVWDGESYKDKYFCNGEHARDFAYVICRDTSYAMPEWFKATGEQPKEKA